jgi:hypothetical protein
VALFALPVAAQQVDTPPNVGTGNQPNQPRPPRTGRGAQTDTAPAVPDGGPTVDPARAKAVAKENQQYVRGIFLAGQARMKDQKYREAAESFRFVVQAGANLAKEEAQAHEALAEIEALAEEHLRKADQAEARKEADSAKIQIEEFGVILRDFPWTRARRTAETRLTALRSRKDVAAYVAYTEAEEAEAAGDLLRAIKLYTAIAENPQNANLLPGVKARKKVAFFKEDETSKEQIAKLLAAQAEKEAPPLLASARNYLLNDLRDLAREKYRIVLERWPGTKEAVQAQAELDKLK